MRLLSDSEVSAPSQVGTKFAQINLSDTLTGTTFRIETEDWLSLDDWRKIVVRFTLHTSCTYNLVCYGPPSEPGYAYLVDDDPAKHAAYFAVNRTVPPLDYTGYELRAYTYDPYTLQFEEEA